ncbi:hypothetical protein ACFRCW_47205, partial [Streptomyces sp. NPDC056653]|uniref:hypothetical protein n=1 Tax=Streptomyces sp. NPDC056653 TaxID=3345894 RepID=UPI003675D14B
GWMAPLGDADAAREERDRGDSRAEEQDSRAGDGPGRPGVNLAGAQATQAVAHSGTWSVMAAGAAAWSVGIFLGMAIARS